MFSTPLQPIETNPGGTLSLQCSVRDASSIEWFKDDRPLTQTSRIQMYKKRDEVSLTVKSVRLDDVGKYRCLATGPGGKVDSVAVVDIRKPLLPPKFQEKLKNTETKEGNRVEFMIQVSGKPSLTWYKDGKLLPIGDRISVECSNHEKGIYLLCIDNAKLADSGRYKCVAKNQAGDCFCSTNLQIKEKTVGPAFGDVNSMLNCNEGENMLIEIPVTGNPAPKVTWYKDNIQLYNFARCKMYVDGNTCKLHMKEMTLQDAGTYKVMAKNLSGLVAKEINVTVTGGLVLVYLSLVIVLNV